MAFAGGSTWQRVCLAVALVINTILGKFAHHREAEISEPPILKCVCQEGGSEGR